MPWSYLISCLAKVLCVAWIIVAIATSLPKSLPCEKWRAKDGEVAPWLQSPRYRVMRFFGRHRDEMADAVIEALAK
jgi:hypothetical protein